MTAIVKKLLWKEVQELKWETLAAMVAVLVLPVSLAFRDVNAALLAVLPDLWLYVVLIAVFFGMRAAAGERTGRVGSFLAALPVSHRLLGAIRLVAMCLASMVPLVALLIVAIVLNAWADDWQRASLIMLATIFLLAQVGTVVGLAIAARAGLGQPTEIRAAFVGFAAILAVGILGFIPMLAILEPVQGRFNTVAEIVLWVGGIVLYLLMILLAAVSGFIRRYSLALGISAETSSNRWKAYWWQPDFLSAPLSALVGKAVREMGWLGLGVIVVSLALSCVAGCLGITGTNQRLSALDSLTSALPLILLMSGFILALLVGVGAVIGDVEPGVNTFWRSRPISPPAWYWTKYGVGLATIFFAVEIPALFFMRGSTGTVAGHRGVLFWLLLWSVTFTFALTATCLVRKPGYAAILAFGAVNMLYALVEGTFALMAGEQRPSPMEIIVPVFVVAFFVSTVVGWWAAVNDVAVT